ncbi:MAG: thioredoxin domain-containing protein [Pyrinomonadaceae bacterium]
MNHQKAPASFAALLAVSALFASITLAQTQKPTPASLTAPAQGGAAQPSNAGNIIAIVNNQPLTRADLDPKAREFINGIDKAIADARRRALDEQINRFLLEAEAKKRGVSVEQLYETEILKRVNDPSDAEIKAVYDQNRAQIGAELETVRPQIIAYLRNDRERQLTAELATRLRASYPVTMGASDVNAPNLAPAAILATVAGRPITGELLNERVKPVVYDLRLKAYEAERQAVEFKINDTLSAAEAKRRNVTLEELYRAEVAGKMQPVTDAEVAKFYEANKARIKGDLASTRADIAAFLEQQKGQQLVSEFFARLRAGVSTRVLLVEPEPPVLSIGTEGAAARGDVNAPVTIVEFTDFQCPACGATYPVIEEALKPYGNRVRFVVRNYPLPQHAQAFKSAEAAVAAKEQGKFFEYVAVLFKNQTALDIASLKKYASDLGLDRARFDAALDGGAHAAVVRRDIADGDKYGVNATPTLFVNGVKLNDLSQTAIKEAVDRALAPKGRAAPGRAAN